MMEVTIEHLTKSIADLVQPEQMDQLLIRLNALDEKSIRYPIPQRTGPKLSENTRINPEQALGLYIEDFIYLHKGLDGIHNVGRYINGVGRRIAHSRGIKTGTKAKPKLPPKTITIREGWHFQSQRLKTFQE